MGGGFEPPNVLPFTRFPGVHNRPLCHPILGKNFSSRPDNAATACDFHPFLLGGILAVQNEIAGSTLFGNTAVTVANGRLTT